MSAPDRLPLASLLALAMAQGLAVSEAWVGQTVTIYAIGSLVAAIPLTAATQDVRRRPLALAAIAGFVVANTVTTFSGSYVLTMVARFLAGVSAGLLWALLAGYAARMVPEHKKGRAIAIAMVGTPLALPLAYRQAPWTAARLFNKLTNDYCESSAFRLATFCKHPTASSSV